MVTGSPLARGRQSYVAPLSFLSSPSLSPSFLFFIYLSFILYLLHFPFSLLFLLHLLPIFLHLIYLYFLILYKSPKLYLFLPIIPSLAPHTTYLSSTLYTNISSFFFIFLPLYILSSSSPSFSPSYLYYTQNHSIFIPFLLYLTSTTIYLTSTTFSTPAGRGSAPRLPHRHRSNRQAIVTRAGARAHSPAASARPRWRTARARRAPCRRRTTAGSAASPSWRRSCRATVRSSRSRSPASRAG